MGNEITRVSSLRDLTQNKKFKISVFELLKNQKLSDILSQLHFFTCYSCDQVFAIHYVNGKQLLCPTCGERALTVLDLPGLLADLYQESITDKRSNNENV